MGRWDYEKVQGFRVSLRKDQKLKQTLMMYRELIKETYAPILDNPKWPERFKDEQFSDRFENLPSQDCVKHIMWMCDKAWDILHEGKDDPSEMEKAMRWLGFIQGWLWCENIRTINQMRDDNR